MRNALQEMAKLLPQGKSPGGTDDAGGNNGYHTTTKVSTIELAVEYIKSLQN